MVVVHVDVLREKRMEREDVKEYPHLVPQYLHYFHAGILRDVKLYEAEDSLSECYWQLHRNGIEANF